MWRATLLDPLDFIALLVAHIPARHEKRAINYAGALPA